MILSFIIFSDLTESNNLPRIFICLFGRDHSDDVFFKVNYWVVQCANCIFVTLIHDYVMAYLGINTHTILTIKQFRYVQ